MRNRLPGDRGLAFVVVGAIGAALLWVHDARVHEVHPIGYSAQASISARRDIQDLSSHAAVSSAFMTEGPSLSRLQTIVRMVSTDFRGFNQEVLRLAAGRSGEIPVEVKREHRAAIDADALSLGESPVNRFTADMPDLGGRILLISATPDETELAAELR